MLSITSSGRSSAPRRQNAPIQQLLTFRDPRVIEVHYFFNLSLFDNNSQYSGLDYAKKSYSRVRSQTRWFVYSYLVYPLRAGHQSFYDFYALELLEVIERQLTQCQMMRYWGSTCCCLAALATALKTDRRHDTAQSERAPEQFFVAYGN